MKGSGGYAVASSIRDCIKIAVKTKGGSEQTAGHREHRYPKP